MGGGGGGGERGREGEGERPVMMLWPARRPMPSGSVGSHTSSLLEHWVNRSCSFCQERSHTKIMELLREKPPK